MLNSFAFVPQTPVHHDVDDAIVLYSNKQPMLFNVDSNLPKNQPLLLELVIISGGVSDTAGFRCKFKTLLTSKFPLIVASLYIYIYFVITTWELHKAIAINCEIHPSTISSGC